MPHLVVEYTDNLEGRVDIGALLDKMHQVLLARPAVFPIGGIRTRAVKLTEYRIADGKEDDAFVHASLKIGAGRSEAEKKEACGALFDVMKEHFAEYMTKRYLALSLELSEFGEGGTYKHNNIHTRFQKP